MDKRILKNIAKDWAGSILYACDMSSFLDLEKEGLLTLEESKYILSETHKIAERISNNTIEENLDNILKKYYTIE